MFRLRRPRGERGASIVELALIAPVMGLIVMGSIDLSRGYRMQIQLENAAREGAAYAQIWPNFVENCGPEASIHERVLLEEPGLIDEVDIRVVTYGSDGTDTELVDCGGDVAGSGDRVRVDVTGTFDVMTPMVERVVGGTIDLTGSAEVEVQG